MNTAPQVPTYSGRPGELEGSNRANKTQLIVGIDFVRLFFLLFTLFLFPIVVIE